MAEREGESEAEFEIDRDALVQAFLAEAGDVLVAMEQLLLGLETHPDNAEWLNALFRSAHTLKGSSSLVAFDSVRDLAHELESLLDQVRSKVLHLDDDLVTLLLQGIDLLRATIAEEAAHRPAPAELSPFVARVRRAAAGEKAPRVGDAEALVGGEKAGGTSRGGAGLAEAAAGADVSAKGASAGAGAPAAEVPVPAAVGPSAPVPEVARPAAPRTLRVDVGKLDRMVNLSGELAIARGRLTDMLERRTALTVDEILAEHREADRLYLDLQDLILQARMVPLGPTFQQHHRTVRDLAASEGKKVRLVLEGEEVEVDTAVVEQIRDPITHMVRNAIDHGLETPEERSARGKEPCGRVTLRAFYEGALVVLQVADDGKGLDRERILKRGRERGLVKEGAALTEEEIFGLIFEPGFSTAEKVTEVSGRGVGMDVVRRNVEALRGSVTVESAPGVGSTITLRFPLTLAIIQGFRVGVAGEVFILPLDSIAECVELPAGQEQGQSGVLDLRGQPLPFLRLREQFHFTGQPPERENVVVVQHGGARVGLAVDALLGESQTVIKPLGRMFQGARGVSGSSILGDGRVALILDVAGLLREGAKRALPN